MTDFRQLRRVRGHAVWLAPLEKRSIIVDAGAHAGQFSQTIQGLCGARCILIEANPTLAAQICPPDGGTVVHAALAAADGEAEFVFRANREGGSIHASSSDRDTQTTTVETVSLATLRRRFHLDRIDLLKLDIEAAEFALIDETPDDVLADIRQITVEFHDFLPDFHAQGLYERARTRLESLGFICANFAFRTHGDVLFLNRRHFTLSPWDRFFLQHIARWSLKLRNA